MKKRGADLYKNVILEKKSASKSQVGFSCCFCCQPFRRPIAENFCNHSFAGPVSDRDSSFYISLIVFYIFNAINAVAFSVDIMYNIRQEVKSEKSKYL